MKDSIYLIFFIFLLSSCTHKTNYEELKEYGEKIAAYNSIEYKVKHSLYGSLVDETHHRIGKVYFESNSKDSLVGVNYYFRILRKPLDFVIFYNGDKEVNLRLKDNTAFLKDLNKHPINQPLFFESIETLKKILKKDSLSSRLVNLVKKDTLIQGEKSMLFSFQSSRELFYQNFNKRLNSKIYVKIGFSSKDRLPNYLYIYESRKDDAFLKAESFFSDVIINKKYPAEKLSVESVPDYFKWDNGNGGIELIANEMPAPLWELPRLSHGNLSIEELKGKTILLEFWYMGCGPCLKAIPDLNRIENQFKDNNFSLISINYLSDNKEKIKEYTQRYNMNYTILWKGDEITKEYKIEVAPTFYLINKDGKIVYSQVGWKGLENLEEEIKKEIFGT